MHSLSAVDPLKAVWQHASCVHRVRSAWCSWHDLELGYTSSSKKVAWDKLSPWNIGGAQCLSGDFQSLPYSGLYCWFSRFFPGFISLELSVVWCCRVHHGLCGADSQLDVHAVCCRSAGEGVSQDSAEIIPGTDNSHYLVYIGGHLGYLCCSRINLLHSYHRVSVPEVSKSTYPITFFHLFNSWSFIFKWYW